MAEKVPAAAATLQRARSLTNEAMFVVALQRRRLRTQEPEDATFVFREWADFQFFVVALRRFRRVAGIGASQPRVELALREFDAALPFLSKFRNVGEHIDEYAVDSPDRRYRGPGPRGVSRRDLQVGQWDDTEWRWLGERVDVDVAVQAAERLHHAVMNAHADPSRTSASLR